MSRSAGSVPRGASGRASRDARSGTGRHDDHQTPNSRGEQARGPHGGRRGRADGGAALTGGAALAVAALAERAAVAASFAVLGHLHWLWIPAALLLESVSMAA